MSYNTKATLIIDGQVTKKVKPPDGKIIKFTDIKLSKPSIWRSYFEADFDYSFNGKFFFSAFIRGVSYEDVIEKSEEFLGTKLKPEQIKKS